MRRIVPALLAAFVVGLAVFATAVVTAASGQRRSMVLLVLAVGLALPTSIGVRRRLGVGAAAAIWLGFAPLGFAIARVMKRHVEALTLMSHSGVWHDPAPLARGALEWRLDTPFVQGNFRDPVMVAFAWSTLAMVVALVVSVVASTRASTLLSRGVSALGWVTVAAALSATGFAIVREAGKTTAMEWARGLPLVPLPEQLKKVDCDAIAPEGETLHGPVYDVEVAKNPCSIRLVRGEARSALTGPIDELTLHHDPTLGLDVLVSRRAISLMRPENAPGKDPPIGLIPLDLRISAAVTSLLALALLLFRPRREPRIEGPTSAYRGTAPEDPLRDDARLVRAAAAITSALLGVAPLVPLIRFVL